MCNLLGVIHFTIYFLYVMQRHLRMLSPSSLPASTQTCNSCVVLIWNLKFTARKDYFVMEHQEVFDQEAVAYKLPVFIPQEVLKANVKFGKLLEELSKRLTSTSGRLKSEIELKKAKDLLHLQKNYSFQYQIMYNCLKKLLHDYELASKDIDPTSDTARNYKVLKNAVMCLEMIDYFKDDVGRGTLPFSATTVEQIYPTINSKVRDWVMTGLGEKICQQCKAFLKIYNPLYSDDDFITAAMQLPDKLSSEKYQLKQMKIKLDQSRCQRELLMRNYHKTLLQNLSILEELIQDFRLSGPSEHHQMLVEQLGLEVEALSLKLQVLQMRILCDSYSDNSVAALKKINDLLQTEIEDTEQEISAAEHALNSYEALGAGFKKLVSEYASLKEQIKNKSWCLQTFKQ